MRAVALYGTIGSLILTALGASTAGGTTTPPDPSGTAEAQGVAIAARRAASTGISFGPCPAADDLPRPVRCGIVTVPLDYGRPDGTTIPLTVSRAPATGPSANRQGALVYNPGGPGSSGMDFPLYAELREWRTTAQVYDFVGYAPRGVGRSAPLSCQDPAEFAKAPVNAAVHPTEKQKRVHRREAESYARGCAEKAGPSLRHYTSLNNARDLDVIRAALGERQLNFLGSSYGTYLGALYAELFPRHVRRMVLDSPVDPDPQKIWYRANLMQSLAFEQRWEDWLAWVARHDSTYDLGRTPDEVQRSYTEARERVEREPAGGTVGSAQLHAAFLKTGYYDGVWTERAAALSAYLRHDDPDRVVSLAAPRPDDAVSDENSNAVYTAVECNDAPWPRDWRSWDRDNSVLAGVAPFETWDNAWMNMPCAYWQAPRQRPLDVRTRPGELPPVLILAAQRDAATPYTGALALHERLFGSSLVTERKAGTHGIAGGQSTCVNRHMDTYLLHGTVPGHGAVCEPHDEPSPEPEEEAEPAPEAEPAAPEAEPAPRA